MALAKNRHIDQWSRMQSPEINPCLHSQIIFDRGLNHIQWAKDSLFNQWCWENLTDMYRKMKVDHLLTPHIKINSKWIKDLNVSSKIPNIAHSNILSNISPQAKEKKEKKETNGIISKWLSFKILFTSYYQCFPKSGSAELLSCHHKHLNYIKGNFINSLEQITSFEG